MGGEGQPQTQAALFARHIYHGQPIAKAISLGRWLLGRTWGDQSHNLKAERDLVEYVGDSLLARGHERSRHGYGRPMQRIDGPCRRHHSRH